MKKLFIVLISIVILTACSNKKTLNYEYSFIGEGEHWESEYTFNGTEIWNEREKRTTYSNENNYTLVIKYKGDIKDISTTKNLEYAYETTAGGGSGTMQFNDTSKEAIFITKGSSTGAKVNADEIIKVTIKWDTFEESFELYNKGK
ncbi:hypothetical protein [Sporosarcina sp. JAI121]|uniref:hypothetical protein n=1 Tax=Sporosarcina sp. JAI121 TaxID=2723064 RepID=UPI0015C90FC8|nr:hypothetical protein [Sporosarcina sp. JAI121]NYF24655.1 hypothetical protein [Sporosarcina sp. JAI121]